MPLHEVLIVSVGMAVARSVLKLWLKDTEIAADVTLSVFDIFKQKIPDYVLRHRAELQFNAIATEIGENLIAFVERETSTIPENEKEAAAIAVADSFNKAGINNEILLSQNLDPIQLESYLVKTVPDAARDLSQAGAGLYKKILRETCNYVIEIVVTLPDFTLKSTQEFLKRHREIIDLVEKVLDHLPKTHASGETSVGISEDKIFEDQYRREVARKLDWLELFGLDVSPANKRYALRVGYITLTASCAQSTLSSADTLEENGLKANESKPKEGLLASGRGNGEPTDGEDEDQIYVRIDEALAEAQRIVIRGEAGSGKTTLLQWLAVQSAQRLFDGPLSNYNKKVPFFLQLRRYVDSDLPPPEEFINQVAKNISGEMPPAWVHRHLHAGDALVMVDGVDELPETMRDGARKWLRDLTESFPESTFIVTSRPPAIGEGWLEDSGFTDCELQPMTLPDIDTFIDHWHDAACGTVSSDEEATELDRFKKTLKRVIRDSRSIRALATSPLLCALLCALNRDRKTQLPKDRMELYRIALEMLLERRDLEREVHSDDIPPPTLAEKQLLLQNFAYWLLSNNYSDAEKTAATECIGRKLVSMHHVKGSAHEVFNFLLLRSGLLREPVEGRIDFLHRTFQEYLGAKEAVEDNDIGVLIQKAHLDQWREVIVLAAGHAQKHQREALIQGLLDRGDSEAANRHRLHLLAIACLETSPDLSPKLTRELQARLRSLIPPRNKTEARALVSAGELAISLLAGHQHQRVGTVAACIRTLALIGGDKALETLRPYGTDSRVTVFRELTRAWTNFDPEIFAREVLAESPLERGQLQLWDKSLLAGVHHLKKLNFLSCNFQGKLTDLTPLLGNNQLRQLDISYCNKISDFAPLAQFHSLKSLDLSNCAGLNDLSPLTPLANLVYLNIANCNNITDIEPLRNLNKLLNLFLVKNENISDFTPLRDLNRLVHLDLGYCRRLSHLDFLDRLVNLKQLNLGGCNEITDILPLSHLESLQWVSIVGAKRLTDISPLSNSSQLLSIALDGCSAITDLRALTDMKDLYLLSLRHCRSITDFSPLSKIQNLKWLHLDNCTQLTDLFPISTLKHLRWLGLDGCQRISDLTPLSALEEMNYIDLDNCNMIKSVAPLKKLKKLRRLYVRNCPGIRDLHSLSELPELVIVSE